MTNEQLCGYLAENCLGRRGTICGRELAGKMGVSENELRRRVNHLRQQGVPIASSQAGYFYAATAGEVYATIRSLRGMAKGLEVAIAGLEKALERFCESDGSNAAVITVENAAKDLCKGHCAQGQNGEAAQADHPAPSAKAPAVRQSKGGEGNGGAAQ